LGNKIFIPILDLRFENRGKNVAFETQKAELERLERKFILEFVEQNFKEPEKDKPQPLIIRIPMWLIFWPLILSFKFISFWTLGGVHKTKVDNARRKVEFEAKKQFKEAMRKEGYDVDNMLSKYNTPT